MREKDTRRRLLWITRTGLLIALLVALQWATAGTQAFAGQYITGSCVNCVLAVAALIGGLWCGVTVALLSPLFAFLLGIGPQLLQVVPIIALGNTVYVVCLYFIAKGRKLPARIGGLAVAAVAKFALLYLGVVHVLIPVMGAALAEPQAKKFTVMFSWPQLVTALLGGAVALLLVPLIQKALPKN